MNEFSKINPRNKMVVIKPFEPATRSQSGLIIDPKNNVSTAKSRGIILEVSADCSPDLKVGMTALFRRYGHDEVKYFGPSGEVVIYLVYEDEILATPEIEEK